MSKMGESKQTRSTKNSQKVTSLEEQNKVLEEVLRASREAAEGKNKDKSNRNKGENPHDKTKQVGTESNSEKKRKAKAQSGSSPLKKPKPNEGEGSTESPQDGNDENGPKMILEYPDYEANREEDFEDGRPKRPLGNVDDKTAGKQSVPSDGQRQVGAEVPRREHEVSSEEEDNIEDYEDPEGYENDDFVGGASWDNHSIASSVIFPSQGKGRNFQGSSSVPRPESARPRSRPENNNNKHAGTGSATNEPGGSNMIESLVKERAGVDNTKDNVGPPVADCIAELLKTYLKEPSSEAMIKLLEDYPRPANADWLQAPMMGTQVAASIPKRSNNYDRRLRQAQLFIGGSLAAMAGVLQDIMDRGKQDSSLLGLAKKVMDAMALSGYVHFDFNSIRKGAIRQVINPSYAGVFTRRTSSTPESLLGENPVPEQLKEYEEINKVRAKLQKPKKSHGGESRHENSRGRGRGFSSGNNRGGFQFQNRASGNYGSGFGSYQNNNNPHQRGGRGSRPNYPHQRRVYGHNHQNNQDQNGHRDQKNL